MIQAILWDMDGVLFDTTALHYWSWQVSLDEYGYKLTYPEFISTYGMNNQTIIDKLLGKIPEADLLHISDRKEYLFREEIDGKVVVFPGVLDWLNFAREKGIPCAVASSAPMENITRLLDHFGFNSYFSATVSAAKMPGKPDPAVFLAAAAQVKIPPQNCLVVEDAPAGASAAKSAGMKCLAVLTTRTPPDFPPVTMFLNSLTDISLRDCLLKIDQAA